MLLNSYSTELVRLSCGSEAQTEDMIAYLNQDISEVIPYLNAVLGGFQYTKDPRSVSLKLNGKLVVIHPREICINAPEFHQGPRPFVADIRFHLAVDTLGDG